MKGEVMLMMDQNKLAVALQGSLQYDMHHVMWQTLTKVKVWHLI